MKNIKLLKVVYFFITLLVIVLLISSSNIPGFEAKIEKPEKELWIHFLAGFIWGNYTKCYTFEGVLNFECELGGLKAFLFVEGKGFCFYDNFTSVSTWVIPFGITKNNRMVYLMFSGNLS